MLKKFMRFLELVAKGCSYGEMVNRGEEVSSVQAYSITL